MKLVLYSGSDYQENLALDHALIKLTEKKDPKITFIPSCSLDADIDFLEFVERFSAHKIRKYINFPIDTNFDDVIKKEALSSDIIYLGGGNTFYFLNYIRKNKMMNELKTFVKKGGVIAGHSAGAILLTPNIGTASFPKFDRDPNIVDLTNNKALGLVDFHFFPHYRNPRRFDSELAFFSSKINKPLYACPDGAGIIVKGKELAFTGKVSRFFRGKKG